jgi:hypothetical protein
MTSRRPRWRAWPSAVGSSPPMCAFGRRVLSPAIPNGEADILVGFEPAEALRWCGQLRQDGVAMVNRVRQEPPVVTLGLFTYPDDPVAEMRARGIEVHAFDAGAIARELGNLQAGEYRHARGHRRLSTLPRRNPQGGDRGPLPRTQARTWWRSTSNRLRGGPGGPGRHLTSPITPAMPAWSPASWQTPTPPCNRPTTPIRPALEAALAELRTLPPLVTSWEIQSLRKQLARAEARGDGFLLQGGDCAEGFRRLPTPRSSPIS